MAELVKTCGSCFFSDMIPNDLTQRICKGAPPQCVVLPSGPGAVQVRTVWPNVAAGDRACALYRQKLTMIEGGNGGQAA